MGVVGGAYGILLASERQKTFSKQVDNAEEQLFNERLGRGGELLAHENSVMRLTGVRVLEDLSKTAKDSQVILIMEIIFDFIKLKTQKKYDANGRIIHRNRADRLDVELAVRIFFGQDIDYLKGVKTIPKVFPGLIKRPYSHWISQKNEFKNMDCCEMDLSHLDFKLAKFTHGYFVKSNFSFSNLDCCTFFGVDLRGTDFTAASIVSVSFKHADLRASTLRCPIMRGVDFEGASMLCADLSNSILEGVKNLSKNQLDEIIFEAENEPTNVPNDMKIDCRRAYKIKKTKNGLLRKRFIKSDAPWSEQFVDEWFESEIAKTEPAIPPTSTV